MNSFRVIASLVFLAAAAAPATAGNFTIAKIPLKGVLAPLEACPQSRAVDVLQNNAMTVVAVVPATGSLHRFVVDWKSDLFAVTVGRNDCHVDVVDYAKAIQPYCNYIPGVMTTCRIETLAQ